MKNLEKLCNVIVTLQIEGVHRWAMCDIPEVAFLKNSHRHVFYITCKKEVKHNDRDIEIICLKHSISAFLNEKYGKTDNITVLDFDTQSCEMIAEILQKEFDLTYCSVLEDGENGAEITIKQ